MFMFILGIIVGAIGIGYVKTDNIKNFLREKLRKFLDD